MNETYSIFFFGTCYSKKKKMEQREKDSNSLNVCSFYEKTGVCSKGELCNKIHRYDPFSRIICLHHLYPDPDLFIQMLPPGTLEITQEHKQRLLDAFFLDVYYMLQRFGPIDDMIIASNKTDTLSGNVWASFRETDAAHACVSFLNGKYYAGRKIYATLTPMIKISNGMCLSSTCPMKENCKFIHELKPSEHIVRQCFNKNVKLYAEPFRKNKIKKVADSPSDALYGRSKYKI